MARCWKALSGAAPCQCLTSGGMFTTSPGCSSRAGLPLTPEGQVIYRHALRMFEQSAQALQEARAAADFAATTFCVGTSILNPCKPFMDL